MEVKTNKRTFIPEKLRSAREVKGLTIRELADEIGVSHQAISKYENSKALPSAEILIKIMSILNVPYEYFFKDSKDKNMNQIVYFRSKANTTAKMKRIHEIKISWLIEIFEYLEEILEFPKLNIFSFSRDKSFFFEPTGFDEIENIAQEIRNFWNLNNGPISDLTHLFEKNGIIVSFIKDSNLSIDACSKWREEDGKLFILIGNERGTNSRIKFTLAHELGHYILHKNVLKTEFNKKDVYKRMEEEANKFASAFLLPRDSFSEELMSNSLDYYLLLKKRWNVSVQAMIYRSYDLNLINDNQYSYLWKQINKKGWRTKEPYDDLLYEESPVLLKEALDLILKHNVKSKNVISSELAIHQYDIEALSNLPHGYLNESQDKRNIVSFKK